MAWVLAEQIEVATTLHDAGFLRDGDEQGSIVRLRAWAEINASNPTAQWVLQRLRLGPVVEPILWFACWARSGFARVTMGHRLAAALIATQAPAEALQELPAPWPAYLIEVPHGLFQARDLMIPDTPQVSFDLVMVRHTPDGMIRIGVRPREGAVTLMRGPLGWKEFVADDFDTVQAMGGLYGTADDLHHRVLTCAARLTAGVELELSDPSAIRSPRAPIGKRRDPRTPSQRSPAYALTRDVTVDARDAVTAFLDGSARRMPSVRTLVRGHWRRQPFGPRAEERRWIHVEPYWRGPEDGPVALGVHRLHG